MAELRAMLNERKPVSGTVEDWAFQINSTLANKGQKVKISTLYSYLNGQRNISGKGAKALAMYFYHCGDMDMVDAITELTLGIPYHAPKDGKVGHRHKN